MKSPSQMSRTAILIESALMVALSFALSFAVVFHMPLGGSVTLLSTLPLLMLSLRHKARWGLAAAAVYGLLQALQGLSYIFVPKTALGVALVFLLDYFLAYLCLGLAGPIARRFRNGVLGVSVGVLSTGILRFVCSFLSGLLIWGAPDYWARGVAAWSFSYNISWCGPDVALVLVAALLLCRVPALHLLPDKSPAAK